MVDFPDKAPPPDGGLDGSMPELDASSDATRDAQPDRAMPDTSTGKLCPMGNSQCDSDELCCGLANTMMCVETSVQRCTACTGGGCDSPRAPNCGDRTCECVRGTNKPCDEGQTCDNTGAEPRCVECAGDGDCAAVAGKPFCENNRCVQCKRGTDLEASVDDVGCIERTPICGPDNTCIGCDDSMPATKCPGMSVCSPGLGCGGCKADQPIIGANGCTQESAPICKLNAGFTQCAPCATNAECRFAEGQGYCANGRCSNKCDGDSAVGANGCTNPAAPFCKPASNVPGGFDCAPCTSADCTNGLFCATTGPRAGSCVGCRGDADCNPNGLAPVCDATSFACRARTMADCAATPATPYLSAGGTCVECTESTQCAANPKGPICNPATNACVACATSSHCPAATPTCNPTTFVCQAGCTEALCSTFQPVAKKCNAAMMACVQCNTSVDCPFAPAPTAAPLCSAGTCVSCTDFPGTNAERDAACSAKTTGARCFRPANTVSNAYLGLCGTCEPGQGQCPGASMCSQSFFVCQ